MRLELDPDHFDVRSFTEDQYGYYDRKERIDAFMERLQKVELYRDTYGALFLDWFEGVEEEGNNTIKSTRFSQARSLAQRLRQGTETRHSHLHGLIP